MVPVSLAILALKLHSDRLCQVLHVDTTDIPTTTRPGQATFPSDGSQLINVDQRYWTIE